MKWSLTRWQLTRGGMLPEQNVYGAVAHSHHESLPSEAGPAAGQARHVNELWESVHLGRDQLGIVV